MQFPGEDEVVDITVKALGVRWNAVSDSFFFSIKEPTDKMASRWTKLGFVSFSHQIYDPLGFLLPVMLASKLIVQSCWALRLDWKDEVPEAVVRDWES